MPVGLYHGLIYGPHRAVPRLLHHVRICSTESSPVRSWLHRLKARDALGLEDLDGIGLQLVITGKTFVKAHNPFGLPLRRGTDQLQSESPLQTNDKYSTCRASAINSRRSLSKALDAFDFIIFSVLDKTPADSLID